MCRIAHVKRVEWPLNCDVIVMLRGMTCCVMRPLTYALSFADINTIWVAPLWRNIIVTYWLAPCSMCHHVRTRWTKGETINGRNEASQCCTQTIFGLRANSRQTFLCHYFTGRWVVQVSSFITCTTHTRVLLLNNNTTTTSFTFYFFLLLGYVSWGKSSW